MEDDLARLAGPWAAAPFRQADGKATLTVSRFRLAIEPAKAGDNGGRARLTIHAARGPAASPRRPPSTRR